MDSERAAEGVGVESCTGPLRRKQAWQACASGAHYVRNQSALSHRRPGGLGLPVGGDRRVLEAELLRVPQRHLKPSTGACETTPDGGYQVD
jgi:hypothetical protein